MCLVVAGWMTAALIPMAPCHHLPCCQKWVQIQFMRSPCPDLACGVQQVWQPWLRSWVFQCRSQIMLLHISVQQLAQWDFHSHWRPLDPTVAQHKITHGKLPLREEHIYFCSVEKPRTCTLLETTNSVIIFWDVCGFFLQVHTCIGTSQLINKDFLVYSKDSAALIYILELRERCLSLYGS